MSPVEIPCRNSVCVWGQVGSKPMLNKGSGGASHDPSAKSNTVRTPRAHNSFDARGALRDDWIVDNGRLRISQLLTQAFDKDNKWGLKKPAEEVTECSEVTAVELNVLGNQQTQNNQTGGTQPCLEVDINGLLYAKGTREMTAKFTIPSNNIAILEGPSAIGKSVLLKNGIVELNAGIVQASKTSVGVALVGKDRTTFNPGEWRQRVLSVPQTASFQCTPEYLLDFVASPPHFTNEVVSKVSMRARTMGYLEAWGMSSETDKLSQPWSKFSGGESQRVLLAIALAAMPTVLLADEVTSALDMKAKLAVEKSLKKACAEGTAIVLVTHDEDQIERIGTMRMRLDVKE